MGDFGPVPPISYPREGGTPVLELPLASEGPADFFPPVCLQTHWDPTKILRWTLPPGHAGQPLDPRPWTRICMQYTTAGSEEPAPDVNPSLVMPSGGQFYPPGRYSAAIDKESELRRLDRPLGTCEADQWEPSLRSDMFDARVLVPRTHPVDPTRIAEVAYPRALLRSGPYDCREQEDRRNVALASDFIFNNATKQDRYKTMGKPARPAPPAETLMASPERMRPDLTFNAGRPMSFAEGSYEESSYKQRGSMVADATTPIPANWTKTAKGGTAAFTNRITGRSIYVNPQTGSDSNQGTEDRPLQSMQAALRAMSR